jgi:phage N-6-adenine-methyltransferase
MKAVYETKGKANEYAPLSDDRSLPMDCFAKLNERFHFTIDAAASVENRRLPRFWSATDNALIQDWKGERVYCNPPYSDIEPWVRKAWWERFAQITVLLLPANRTDQAWWQHLIEPLRDKGPVLRVEFLPGRIRFLRPGQLSIGPNERPRFSCCLCIWDWQKGRT